MSIKIKDIRTKIIKEKDGSYAVACSLFGVYSAGKTLAEAKRSFKQGLELHLSVLKEKAVETITQ
jgi:predicted RNase H-like HicB family nuclease